MKLTASQKAFVTDKALHTVIIILLCLTIFPVYLLITMSLKSDIQLSVDIFGLPNPIRWSNYNQAFYKLIGNLFNSIFISVASTVTIMFLSALTGFAFSRMQFPGKNFFYLLLFILMMIPGILALAPKLKLIEDLGLKDSWWSLYLTYIAGGQVMGTVLCKNFLDGQPKELFQAAVIDGAGTFDLFLRICLPLAKPILSTIFVLNVVEIYNDYFTPFMYLESMDKMPITVALKLFQVKFLEGQSGAVAASMFSGFAISTIPLIIIFMFGSKVYVEGLTSGAVKM